MKDEKELIIHNFQQLFAISYKKGHISDDVYDELGFPNDQANNRIILRNHDIASEWMQRAKHITHEFQHMLRRAREQLLQDEFNKKMEKQRKDIESILNLNQEAEECLLTMI